MDVMKSKSAFMNADLDTMLEQAKTNLENGKLTKNLSRNAKNLLKQQVQQLKTMKAQQSISKKLADNYGEVSGFVDKIKDGFEMLKASPLAAVLITIMGVMEKMVGKVEAAAKDMNAEVGIGLVNSVKEASKQMAAMPASSIMESMGLAPQVAKRAREAATTAAAVGGDLALMQNMAIGINEAVAELDYGVAASQVAELADNLFVTTNLTREQASAALNATAEFARQNKVAPKKVLEDMAQNAQVLAKFSDGTAEGMARAAVQAARLGLELSAVGQVMDGLLNLESSIASEFEASVLLGKELNLDRARTLALNNDMEGAMKEIVKQVGSEAEFQQMNAIQRQSLADAVGLSTDQLAQMMKKGGRAQLEGSVPEKQLKNLDDLRVSAGIQEGFLSRIATLVSGILSFLLAGKGLSLLGDIASMFRGRGRGFFRDRARRTRGGRSVFDRAMQMKKSRAARAPRGPGIIDKMKGRGSNLMKRLSQSKFATKATQLAGKGTQLAGGAIQSVKGGIGAIGGSAFKMLGRVALPLAAAADALFLGSELTKENATTESKTKAVGSVAGGWAGAAGGAKAGALIGAMAGPLGAAVGGVLGGAVGYVAGSKFGEAVANPIRGSISAGMDYLGPKMDQAMNKAKEFGVSLGNDISNIKSKASEFGSKVVEFGGTVKNKLSSGLNTARGKINELSSAVGKNLVGAVGKAKSKISSMMSSIKSKAASLASSAKSTASSALNAAANFMGFKAAGGPVYKSGTYMVGERGPELVHLSRGSTVVPNHQIQGGAAQGAGGDLVAELRALRTELDKIAANTARGANAAERTKIGSAA